jgi:hypothetical protein
LSERLLSDPQAAIASGSAAIASGSNERPLMADCVEKLGQEYFETPLAQL